MKWKICCLCEHKNVSKCHPEANIAYTHIIKRARKFSNQIFSHWCYHSALDVFINCLLYYTDTFGIFNGISFDEGCLWNICMRLLVFKAFRVRTNIVSFMKFSRKFTFIRIPKGFKNTKGVEVKGFL